MSFYRTSKIIAAVFVVGILFFGISVAATAPPCQPVTIGVPDANGTTTNCIPTGGQTVNDNPIVIFLRAVIQFFAVGVGILVTGGWVTGTLMYTTARGNAGQVEKAQEILRNSTIGFLLFLGLFAIINFFIPGGVLG